MTTMEFLRMLYGSCEEGCLTITTLPDKKNRHIPVTELDKAAEQITELGKSTNTYYSMALRIAGLSDYMRGGISQIHTVVCMYADIDVKGPEHSKEAIPATREEAIEFINGLAVKPSILVNSGNGLHAIWLLDKPFVIHSEEDRQHIQDVSNGFGIYIHSEGEKKKWNLDCVCDIPRMLRAPGSLNFKSDPPRQCEVLTAEEIRYPLSKFEEYKRIIEKSTVSVDHSEYGSAERMRGRCKFIDHCIRNAATLSEPVWHGFLSEVSNTKDGEEKAHEWSRDYPGYSYEQTQEYYKRAVQKHCPCSCQYIRNYLGFECPEGGCGVKSPIRFAAYTQDERMDMLLAKGNLTVEEVYETKNLLLADYERRNNTAKYAHYIEKIRNIKEVNLHDFKDAMDRAVKANAGSGDAIDDFAGLSTPLEVEGIDTMGLYVPGGWEVDEDGVARRVYKDGVPILISILSTPAFLSRQLLNVDDGGVKLEIAFFAHDRWCKSIVPRGDLMDKGKIVKLADKGLGVTSETSRSAVIYMEAFETLNKKEIPLHRSIERMGWVGEKEFFPYHMTSPAVYDGAGEESHRMIAAVTSHGKKEKWMKMAAKLRTMQAARAMLAASFASVLLSPIQHRAFVFHIWANSRSGKTAVLKAAVSVYGDPKVLLRSYQSTIAGMERTAGIVKNIPMALDELQAFIGRPEQLVTMIYTLGNGIGKMRADRNGGTQKMETWCNIILSTGEQPLTAENAMDGENTRCLELYDTPIADTDFAREVHQTTEENYGFAGQVYVDYLFREFEMEKGAGKLRKEYTKFREEFISTYEMLYDKCTSIYLDYTAILAFADYLSSIAVFGMKDNEAFGEALNFGFNLLEMLKKETKADTVDRAWDAVNEWIVANKDHFEVKKNAIFNGKEYSNLLMPLYGRYEPGEKRLYIMPSFLRNMLTEAGFSYEKSIKGFKDRGYVSNKQQQHRIGAKSVKVIAADMELDYGDED